MLFRAPRRTTALTALVLILAAVGGTVLGPAFASVQTRPGVGGPLELRVALPTTDASSGDQAGCTSPWSVSTTLTIRDSGFVWGPNHADCVEVDYALFIAGSVRAVTWTTAPAGTVLVNVVLNRPQLGLFQRAIRSAGTHSIAVVALNQILSYYSAGPDTGPSIQVMGGLGLSDPRPAQLARALRAPLREIAPGPTKFEH